MLEWRLKIIKLLQKIKRETVLCEDHSSYDTPCRDCMLELLALLVKAVDDNRHAIAELQRNETEG